MFIGFTAFSACKEAEPAAIFIKQPLFSKKEKMALITDLVIATVAVVIATLAFLALHGFSSLNTLGSMGIGGASGLAGAGGALLFVNVILLSIVAAKKFNRLKEEANKKPASPIYPASLPDSNLQSQLEEMKKELEGLRAFKEKQRPAPPPPIDTTKKIFEEMTKKCEQLQQENEELKNKVGEKQPSQIFENEELKKEIERLHGQIEQLQKGSLEKTDAEIKVYKSQIVELQNKLMGMEKEKANLKEDTLQMENPSSENPPPPPPPPPPPEPLKNGGYLKKTPNSTKTTPKIESRTSSSASTSGLAHQAVETAKQRNQKIDTSLSEDQETLKKKNLEEMDGALVFTTSKGKPINIFSLDIENLPIKIRGDLGPEIVKAKGNINNLNSSYTRITKGAPDKQAKEIEKFKKCASEVINFLKNVETKASKFKIDDPFISAIKT